MDSSKNGRWIIPFKKYGMVRVNMQTRMKLTSSGESSGTTSIILTSLVYPNTLQRNLKQVF